MGRGAHCDVTKQHSSIIVELAGSIYLTYYEKEKNISKLNFSQIKKRDINEKMAPYLKRRQDLMAVA